MAQVGVKKRNLLLSNLVGFLILFIVLGLIAFLIYADLTSKYKFTQVNEAMKSAQQSLVTSDAIEQQGYTLGNGVIADLKCLPDEQCPTVVKSWFIPFEEGKELDSIKLFLEKEGYVAENREGFNCKVVLSQGCTIFASKGQVKAMIIVESIKPSELPKKDIQLKAWRYIRINFTHR